MAEKSSEAGPIRLSSGTDTLNYRNRESQARSARHAQATLEAAQLFEIARAKDPDGQPVWMRAVILLMQPMQADYAVVTVVQGEEGRRCRITRGCGLLERPSRRWPGQLQAVSVPGLGSTLVEIETLSPVTTPSPASSASVPGATSSFHVLLYASGTAQPVGCLSLYSATDLSLTADRAAWIDAVAALLAQELTEAPLPNPSPA
jgi:hypothetical protein